MNVPGEYVLLEAHQFTEFSRGIFRIVFLRYKTKTHTEIFAVECIMTWNAYLNIVESFNLLLRNVMER